MTSMKRRCLLLASGVLASGCASLRAGEFMSIALWNTNTDHPVDDVKVVDAAGYPWASAFSLRRAPPTSTGWENGGPTFMADSGFHMPDRVQVGWRLPPTGNQRIYQGDPVGPFELALRSVIPPEVIAMATGTTRYQLSVGIGVGVEPVKMRWALFDYQTPHGIATVRRGGDWAP
ncbi:hypothetical protein BH09PSE6_BH09PSE6_25290 [soil metagenome]